MTSLADSVLAVTDVETTGLSPRNHRITEVAAVLLQDGDVIDEFHTLVNPEQFIPAEIQRLTGITNATVLGAPPAAEAFPAVRDWFDPASAVVAHNAKFDHDFLQASFDRTGVHRLQIPTLCTARLARRLLPSNRRFALASLTAYFGIRVRSAHSALGDARATAQLLLRLLELLEEQLETTTLEEALSTQHRSVGAFRSRPRSVRSLEPTLQEIPRTPGVYRMIDRHGEILYVGKAKNLRMRVASYFQAGASHQRRIAEMVRRVRSIETEETGSELGALLLESRQIKQLQPRYNTLQKRVRHYYFVRIDRTEAFPVATLCDEIESDGAEYFGPFAGRHGAALVLDTIAKLFTLRCCDHPIEPSTSNVPCLYHGMHRCGAPCAALQSEREYHQEVERVRAFLSCSEEGIVAALEQRMHEHAEALQFEEAAMLRNRCVELRRVFAGRRRIADSINNNNVVIVLPAPETGKRELFMVRFGRLAAQRTVGRRIPKASIRRDLLGVYFDGSSVPSRVEREELESIRIIASYVNRYRDSGRFVYVEPEDSPDAVIERLVSGISDFAVEV